MEPIDVCTVRRSVVHASIVSATWIEVAKKEVCISLHCLCRASSRVRDCYYNSLSFFLVSPQLLVYGVRAEYGTVILVYI